MSAPPPIISPSLLSCDFANMESELKAFKGEKDIWIHLDIMDGHFVPNLTFGHGIVERISGLTEHPLDAHLMVTNPALHVDKMKTFGLYNVTFHHEAVRDSLELIATAKEFYPSVGLSIKPKTPVSALGDDVLQRVDLVLVMSVEPGYGGQTFLPEALEKIKLLRSRRLSLGTDFIIQVDGGIDEKTARQALASGADNLVAGSSIFGAPPHSYTERVRCLRP
ncbi:MAG: ribulose-phosphate 3-epimerase [Bacteriovoracales bacterium]|nr:ribulose-phosphate 3-epimerase [Bacteriovoracales bacterium]